MITGQAQRSRNAEMWRNQSPDLRTAIAAAKANEKQTGSRHYVQWSVPMRTYLITQRMPMIGYYDSDGIYH